MKHEKSKNVRSLRSAFLCSSLSVRFRARRRRRHSSEGPFARRSSETRDAGQSSRSEESQSSAPDERSRASIDGFREILSSVVFTRVQSVSQGDQSGTEQQRTSVGLPPNEVASSEERIRQSNVSRIEPARHPRLFLSGVEEELRSTDPRR